MLAKYGARFGAQLNRSRHTVGPVPLRRECELVQVYEARTLEDERPIDEPAMDSVRCRTAVLPAGLTGMLTGVPIPPWLVLAGLLGVINAAACFMLVGNHLSRLAWYVVLGVFALRRPGPGQDAHRRLYG